MRAEARARARGWRPSSVTLAGLASDLLILAAVAVVVWTAWDYDHRLGQVLGALFLGALGLLLAPLRPPRRGPG